jgi:serine/threonine protein kinase
MSKLKKSRFFETAFSRYAASEQIGEGGTGTVFKASDDAGQVVAIKVLDAAKATRERRRRFKNELTFGERNRHKNVITVLDHGVETTGTEPTPFYVMTFYEKSLRSVMNDGIKHDEVLPLFAQCLDGVEAAHLQGVIHRDLKPENILYDAATNNLVVADFGVAEFAQEELYTLVETKPGTRLANFLYAAPEQKQRNGRCSPATDIFSLGLILNEMFTGAIALGTGYPIVGALHPTLAYLDELVSWMIQQDVRNRPDSIDVVKRELIGRRNAFVERQELDRLKQTVIPAATVDDPIVADPIRVVDADWENGTLTLTLSQPVNADWTQVLQFGAYSRSSLMSAPPERFTFRGNLASVPVNSRDAQQAIDYFKSWLPYAHEIYVRQRRQEKEKRERQQREALEREIKAREEREAVRGRLRV